MGLELEPKEGDTLLSPEELDDLIPKHITNRNQLDEVEQNNIEDAFQWLLSKKVDSIEHLISTDFQNELHKKMLGKVWKWAGKIRSRKTNIGVNHLQIEISRKQLYDDAIFWFQNETFDPIELALRFHHRLVKIHCYPNGNGRHSRIIADLMLEKVFKAAPLNWKGNDFVNINKFRTKYIAALKEADKGNYVPLLECVER